jgi:DNA-binding FrmR family transcriptional regulator
MSEKHTCCEPLPPETAPCPAEGAGEVACTRHQAPGERPNSDSLLRRLSRIEGQIRGIRGMVEKEAYCTDILTQVSAAQAALNAFAKELLGNHIRTCVVQDIQAGRPGGCGRSALNTIQKLMK